MVLINLRQNMLELLTFSPAPGPYAAICLGRVKFFPCVRDKGVKDYFKTPKSSKNQLKNLELWGSNLTLLRTSLHEVKSRYRLPFS